MVKESEDLARARTLMELNNFSQLPVVRGKGSRPVGVVSWETIGRSILEKPDATLADCIDRDAPTLGLEADLLDAIPIVGDSGYVLVVDSKNNLSGIVTSADLGEVLVRIGGPVVLFERLEESLRRTISNLKSSDRISRADIQRAIPNSPRPHDGPHEDFTLGEVASILMDSSVWAKTDTSYDRSTFKESLDRAVALRNHVMHFRKLERIHERTLEELPRIVELALKVEKASQSSPPLD
ncbi:CBS domain-containing protein [Gulosibacter macacae]|nr:CBS domain-containing protein [Gulosibacter macacae]